MGIAGRGHSMGKDGEWWKERDALCKRKGTWYGEDLGSCLCMS